MLSITIDGNNFAINKKIHFLDLKKSISDLEIMTDTEWLQYQKSLLVSFMADISSETSYKLRSSTKKEWEIISDGDIEYFFSDEPLTEDVETIYVKYQNRYFFLHDRKTVTPETIRLKTELRVKNDSGHARIGFGSLRSQNENPVFKYIAICLPSSNLKTYLQPGKFHPICTQCGTTRACNSS